jgi:uncharacterized membrane protein
MEQNKGENGFLLLGTIALILGATVVVAVETLNFLIQLPILIFAIFALIVISRRVVKLESFFVWQKSNWTNELAKFREENK